MSEPINPYAPPAHAGEEPPKRDPVPGVRRLVAAALALVCWYLLRRYLGWSVWGVAVALVSAIFGAGGFAQSLIGLHEQPPPRSRLPVLLALVANGLVGSLAGILTLVSLAVRIGSTFDYSD